MRKGTKLIYRDVMRLEIEDLLHLSLPSVKTKEQTNAGWPHDFYEASLLTRDYLTYCASVKPNRNLPATHKAILIGHMVRLFKLYDTFLLLVAADRSEVAYIFCRLIIEVGIHLEFLMKKGDAKVFKEYQHASLAHDKKYLERMIQHHDRDARLGNLGPLKKEISLAFERAGFQIPEIADKPEWGGSFRDTFKKAQAVGAELEYNSVFRYSSHAVHGTWSDIEHFHIFHRGDTYLPKTSFKPVGPELLPGMAQYCQTVAMEYIVFMWVSNKNPLMEPLGGLGNWFHRALEAYEEWKLLAKKKAIN